MTKEKLDHLITIGRSHRAAPSTDWWLSGSGAALGCILGTLMACGLYTIAETRHHANEARFTTCYRIIDDYASDAGLEEIKPERE